MARIFTLNLTGAQEAPTPVATAASGAGMIFWDPATGTAAYAVTVAGLDAAPLLGMAPQTADPTDDVTNMHVHNAPRGAAGPVVFGQANPAQDADDLSILPNPDGSWTARGVWEPADPATVPIGTFAGALTSAPVGSDVALYFNVHSREFPAGEIRGQWVASGSREEGTGGDDTIAAAADGGILFAFGRGGDDSLAGGGPANLPDGLADLLANLLDGGGGNDAILGGDAADRIKGGPGDDLLTGQGGRDVFIFRAAQATGTDTVTDFGSDDVVRLAGFAADFDPLAHLAAVRGGAALDLGGGDRVVFLGRGVAEFTAADFVFGG